MSENSPETVKSSSAWRISLLILIIVCSLAILLSGMIFILNYNHKNEIHKGVNIENLDLSGLTKTQAKDILSGQIRFAFGNGYNFKTTTTEKTIADSERKIFDLNYDNTIDQAFNYGRTSSLIQNSWQILSAALLGKTMAADYHFDKELLRTKLQEEFKAYEKPSQNADLQISVIDDKSKTFEIVIQPSTTGGSTFDYNSAINELEKNIIAFNNEAITIKEKNEPPKITTAQAEQLRPTLEAFIKSIPEIKLIYKDLIETISWTDFTTWVHLGLNDKEEPALVLDETIVKGRLTAMAQKINKAPVDAKLQMKNNKVSEFEASQTGLELDIDASYQLIKKSLLEDKNFSIDVIVKETEPQVALKDINGLGIKEIIGTGSSDFSGSPNNRRVNIGVGAAAVHGVLVAPNEEFSLVKVLGDVDAKNGYLHQHPLEL